MLSFQKDTAGTVSCSVCPSSACRGLLVPGEGSLAKARTQRRPSSTARRDPQHHRGGWQRLSQMCVSATTKVDKHSGQLGGPSEYHDQVATACPAPESLQQHHS